MVFISANGTKKNLRNPTKYLVKWDGKCRSKFQENVKAALRPYWQYDVVFEEIPVLGTRMTIDFYNASRGIAVEVDGDQHYQYNPFFHRGSRLNYKNQIIRDDKKEIFCQMNDIQLVRILYSDKITLDFLATLGLITV